MSEFEFIKSWYYYSIIAEESLVSMRVFRTQGQIHLRWITNCIFYLSEERELIQNFASVLSIGGVDTVSSTGSDGARRSRYAPQRSPSASVNFQTSTTGFVKQQSILLGSKSGVNMCSSCFATLL